MGVLACDRVGCENIMCDRCILNNTAYICGDCYDELMIAKQSWPNSMTVNELRAHIIEFMDTLSHGRKLENQSEIDEEFKRLTGKDNDI